MKSFTSSACSCQLILDGSTRHCSVAQICSAMRYSRRCFAMKVSLRSIIISYKGRFHLKAVVLITESVDKSAKCVFTYNKLQFRAYASLHYHIELHFLPFQSQTLLYVKEKHIKALFLSSYDRTRRKIVAQELWLGAS